MSKNVFGMSTSELADNAKIERATVYQALAASGQWRGICPRKMPNGRLLWPRDEVNLVLGIVPGRQAMTIEARKVVAFLDHCKIPLTPDAWAVVRVLTRGRCDPDLDPNIEASANVLPLIFIMLTGLNRLGTSLMKCDEITRREVIDEMNSLLVEIQQSVEGWREIGVQS